MADNLRDSFDPMRSDYITVILQNSLSRTPWVLAVAYVIFIVFGVAGSAFLQDAVFKTETFSLISKDYANIINFCLVLPIGVFLVINFYQKIKGCFCDIADNGVLSFSTQRHKDMFFAEIDYNINRSIYFWIAIVMSLCVNGLIVLNLNDTNAWNALQFSMPSILFRVVTFINMYVMILVLLKSYVVVREITAIFSNQRECSISISEFHEDGCAGLGALGRLSVSINYFVGLVTVYLLVLIGFKSAQHQISYYDNIFFFPSILIFVLFSLYLFLSPLYSAHRYVKKWKVARLKGVRQYLLSKNNQVEDHVQGDSRLSVDLLYYEMRLRCVSKVSTWATDSTSLRYFVATILFPFAIALVIEWLKVAFSTELGL